jgi:hypothetical protein
VFICKQKPLKPENKIKLKKAILRVGDVHFVQQWMYSLFSSCLMQLREEFLCHGNGSPDEIIVDLFGTGELGNVSLNSVCQVKSERDARRCLTMNTRWTSKKTNFHFDRLKTTDGLA